MGSGHKDGRIGFLGQLWVGVGVMDWNGFERVFMLDSVEWNEQKQQEEEEQSSFIRKTRAVSESTKSNFFRFVFRCNASSLATRHPRKLNAN